MFVQDCGSFNKFFQVLPTLPPYCFSSLSPAEKLQTNISILTHFPELRSLHTKCQTALGAIKDAQLEI